MKYKAKIIPYVMAWDAVVTNYHKQYLRKIKLTGSVEVYIQTIMPKKTLESISFEYRRGSSVKHGDDKVITVRLDAGEGWGEPSKLIPEVINGI